MSLLMTIQIDFNVVVRLKLTAFADIYLSNDLQWINQRFLLPCLRPVSSELLRKSLWCPPEL